MKKALYGLKQAPIDWYARLTDFLIDFGFVRDIVERTLFIKKSNGVITVAQIYVDDIVFGSTCPGLLNEFAMIYLIHA